MSPHDLDALIASLRQLPGALVGNGPGLDEEGHPSRLDEFLASAPAVARDTGYVDFLRRYSGVWVNDEAGSRTIDVFGFGDVGGDIDEVLEPVTLEQPYVGFADCIYNRVDASGRFDLDEYLFAFSNDLEAEPGVYVQLETMAGVKAPWLRCSDSFIGWLRELVRREGWWGRDLGPGG